MCNLHATLDNPLNYELLKSQLSPISKIVSMLQFPLQTGPIPAFSVV